MQPWSKNKSFNILYPHTQLEKKPQTYREKARKDFLAQVKQKRPGEKKLRRGINQQFTERTDHRRTVFGEFSL